MKKKHSIKGQGKIMTKKKWEKPALKTLPFNNTLSGAIKYTYEDAFYS